MLNNVRNVVSSSLRSSSDRGERTQPTTVQLERRRVYNVYIHQQGDRVLNVVNLGCERDSRTLFANLSFTLSPGETLQIEGCNGAGKTTLLKIIASLSHDYNGNIFWAGCNLKKEYTEYRLLTYFLGHRLGLKPELTPAENLLWRHRLSGRTETLAIDDALSQMNLQGYEHTPCHQLSIGQQRRVALAGLLTSGATVWILDEPFTAIDAEGVCWLEQLIEQHACRRGMTIISSHQFLSKSIKSLRRLTLEDNPEANCGE